MATYNLKRSKSPDGYIDSLTIEANEVELNDVEGVITTLNNLAAHFQSVTERTYKPKERNANAEAGAQISLRDLSYTLNNLQNEVKRISGNPPELGPPKESQTPPPAPRPVLAGGTPPPPAAARQGQVVAVFAKSEKPNAPLVVQFADGTKADIFDKKILAMQGKTINYGVKTKPNNFGGVFTDIVWFKEAEGF